MMIPVRCTSVNRKDGSGSRKERFISFGPLFCTNASRQLARAALFFLVTLVVSFSGMGQITRTWLPTNGGAWTTTTNWSPAGVPTSTDTVVINSAQSAAITAVPAITLRALVVNGSCSLEASGQNSTLTISGYFFVGNGVTMDLGTGRMHFTLNAGAVGNIQGIFTQPTSGTAKIFTCGGDLTVGSNGYIDGAGSFTLTSTGTLRIGSNNGITAGTVLSGNVRVTGTRTYDPAAAYVYNGTAGQVTGDGLPATLTNSFSIDNPSTVTLSAARTLSSGTLNLIKGSFTTNNLFTVGNSTAAANVTIVRSGGAMTGILQGGNWYAVNYTEGTKSIGDELSGSGFRNMSLNMNSQQILTLTSTRVISGTLTLNSGLISTGTFALNLTGTLSGGNSASYIIGNMQRSIASGANSYLYPLGSATAYAPVTLNFGASTVAGSLTGSTINGDHPSIGSSTINSFRSVNRSWQFSINSGLTTFSYGALFNWVSQDMDANFNAQNSILGHFANSTWTLPVVAARTSTSIEASGLSAFGEFQVGLPCQMTTITSQPVGGAICQGNSILLSVNATGDGVLTYQWRNNGQNIVGATASTYQATEVGIYSVVVTGECRSATSSDAEVILNLATTITSGPVAGIICPGQQHQLNVTAQGQGALSYQWRKDNADIPGAVNSTYFASEEGNYTVAVSALCGTVSSSSVFVKMNKATSIISQPGGGAVCSGSALTIRVNADGEGTLSYQWKRDGEAIVGATGLSYSALLEGQYTVDVTGTCGTASSDGATLTINPLTTIITQPQIIDSITYGDDANFGLQAAGTGQLIYMWMVNNGTSWSQINADGVFGSPESANLTLVNPSVALSGYQFKCMVSGSCGDAESNPVTLRIRKAPLTIKADDQEKIYGGDNPTFTYQYAGFVRGESKSNSGVNGAPVFTSEVNNLTPVGSYPIILSVGSLTAANYRFVFVNGNLKVNKAMLQVKADDKERVYGDGNPELTSTFTGFVNNQSLSTSGINGLPIIQTNANENSPVGEYDITINVGSIVAQNYAFSFVIGKMRIGKALITVKAEDKNKLYGQANPGFTASFTGFRNGHILNNSGISGSPAFNTNADELSGTGDYTINVSQGTLASPNYKFEFINGKLSIGKASVKIKADDKNKVFGEDNPSLSASYSGFVNGESIANSGISGIPSLTTLADKRSAAGIYTIEASLGNLASSNYVFTFENGSLTVEKATLIIKADNKTKIYGEENPSFTASYDGFVNGESLSVSGIIGEPVLSSDATTISGVGEYDIYISKGSLLSPNYDFSVEGGKLTINKATLKVTADDKNRKYGESNPSFTANFSGFVNGQSYATSGISGIPSFNTDADVTSSAGEYTISIADGSLASSNYAFAYANGKLTIDKAILKIKAEDKSRLYGDANPVFTMSYNGFMNGETLSTSGISGTPELTSDATESSAVGVYDITTSVGSMVSSNYSFIANDGKLSVGKATVTVKVDDMTKVYGQSNPNFTASYTGFVNNETLASSGVSGMPIMSTSATVESGVGTYDISITQGSLSSGNYTFALEGGKLIVTKAVITVTADDKTRKYGEVNPVFTASYNGFVNGQSFSSSGISGLPAYSTDANTASVPGNYSIVTSTGSLASANYSFVFTSGKLIIGKAFLTITAENKSRLYGQPNPSFTASYNGFVNGEIMASSGITGMPSLTSAATVSSSVGVYDITANLGSLVSSKYEFVFSDGKLSVGKAALSVKADDKIKVYGQPNPTFTVNFNGFVNNETLASSGISGIPTMSTSATAQTGVGVYDINISEGSLSSGNYAFTYETGKLTVSKAIIKVSADDKNRTYGEANPALTSTYSGFVNSETLATSGVTGTPAISTDATTASNAGNYAITVSVGTMASANYSFEYETGKLTIGKAPLNVTADNKSRIYGEENPVFSASYSGFVNGESLSTSGITGAPSLTTTATSFSTVGQYDINANLGSLSSVNYSFIYKNGKLNISKAAVTVKAEDKVKVFGDPNPVLSASYVGLVNGESFETSGITGAPVLSTTADLNSPVGAYDISITSGNLFSANYDFTYQSGKLSVTRAIITVAAQNISKIYGQANPQLTVSYSGFRQGESLINSDLTGTPVVTTVANQSSSAGTYDIVVDQGTLISSNYEFDFKNATLTIQKAPLRITALDKSRNYGDQNPQLSVTYSGFVNGETLATSGITGSPNVSTDATSSSPAGMYVIAVSQGSLVSGNYSFEPVNGKLNIEKVLLVITADDKTKKYGEANPQFTASYFGFVNGETFATSKIIGSPEFYADVSTSTPVGEYSISLRPGTLSSANYNFTYLDGNFKVTKTIVNVAADDKMRLYGQVNPELTASFTGFVNGETLSTSGISGSAALSTDAIATSNVGNYVISAAQGTLVSSNYDFEFSIGKLAVTKATIVVTAENKSKTYGQPNPSFTSTFNGFVNGETFATSGINGAVSLSSSADVLSSVGVYDILVAEGTLVSSNYAFSYNNGKLTIGKSIISVTAENKTKVYGEQNPVFSVTYNGFVNSETISSAGISGTPQFTTSVTPSTGVGSYDIFVSQGSLFSSNYDFTYVKGTLTVSKAILKVTADDKSKIYGSSNPAFTASYNGFVNGETLSTSGISGSPILSSDASISSIVGTYVISASRGSLSSSNYEFEFTAGKLAITKSNIVVTADNKSKVYGEQNPVFTASFNGFVNGQTFATSGINGTVSLSSTATSSSGVGSYDIVAAVGTLASDNYTFTFNFGKLTVGKAMLTVKAEDKSKVYGQDNPLFTSSYNGFVNNESISSGSVSGAPQLISSGTSNSDVGSYDISVSIGSLSSSNYDFTLVNGTLTVTKAVVKVIAEDKSKVYGSTNPVFSAVYQGFVNGETLATSGIVGDANFTTSATETSAAGIYDIQTSKGSLSSSNYDFDFVNGKLTITKSVIKVIAQDASRLYGAQDPIFKAAYEGFVNGESLTSSGITGVPSFITNATITSPVAVYTLSPELGTLYSGNYQFEFVSGKYTVGKASVKVKANNTNKLYGQSNPSFEATISDFVNGENLSTSGISGVPEFTTSANQSSPVGSYDINVSVGSLISSNYSFVYEIGTLNINKAVVKVRADDKSRAYGIQNPALTASYTGFVNGETFASSGISGQPEITTNASIISEAGSYEIKATEGTLSASNYAFTFESGKLTIGRNVITITADIKTRKYGQANPELTFTYNGFLNGQTLATSGITGQPVLTTDANVFSPVGTYDVIASTGTLTSDNYDFTFVKGSLQVEKALITVTPVDASRIYGAANPSLNVNYSGFANGETLLTSGITGAPELITVATATSPVGTYSIDAIKGTLSSSNYEFIFSKGSLQINKAQLTVSAIDASKVYGSANPVFTASFNGFVNGETLTNAGVSGQPSFTTIADASSSVGQYVIETGSGTLGSDNYRFVFVNGKLNVTKAMIVVTADNKSRLYGASNPDLAVTYTGFVNGENFESSGLTGGASISTLANTFTPAGQYDIIPGAGTLSSANYDFSFVKGTLIIGKVTLTASIDNKTRVYGAANPVFTIVYNGFVNGETLATSGITGSPDITTSAGLTSAVGLYDINGAEGTFISKNYDLSFIKGSLQITKALVTVKADNIEMPYGTVVPMLTASYIGLRNGETFATSGITGNPVLTTAATSLSPIGTYPVSITLGTLQSNNYSFTLESGDIKISRAVITVTADNKIRTYGENNPPLTFSYSGFVNGETLASSGVTGTPVISTGANIMTDAGNHDILVAAGSLASSNYDFKFISGVLTIKKAMLTVTPENKSRAYGAPDPAFTVTYSGFVNGELMFTSAILGIPVLTTTASSTSPVGTYDINASLGTLFSPNYDFSFAKGTLTIGKANVVVRANDLTRPFGSTNPVFTASYIGFVNGETFETSGITGAPSMTSVATSTSLVGTYDIQTGLGTLESTNYIFSFAKGTLTVSKAVINVIAENKTRMYWEDDPALTYTFNGFVNGETLLSSGITGQPELNTDVIPYSNAGIYPINITTGTLSSSKYSFNLVDGTFTVRKRTVTVTPDNKSRLYGQSNPVFTASYTGFVAGENYVSSIKGSPAYIISANATSAIGAYDINASVGTLTAENYDFIFSKGTLTIGKAVITVKADNKNKLYGATNPAMTATYSGFMNGEALATSDVKGAPAFSTSSNLLSPVGDYPITISTGTLTSDNYTFQFVNSNLTVTKATIIVTADDKNKIYGSPNPVLSVSYSGFVNGETLANSGVTGTPNISTAVTTASSAGSYDITASLGSLTSNNYLFIFLKGKLNVGKATITVTPDNKWRIYGEQNPVFTASYSGFINGESLANSGITGAPALVTTASPSSGAGSYDISASLGTLASANYSFEYAKGTLNVGKATITVTPDNKIRIYGSANPIFTAAYTGFANGENLASSGITGSPTLTTSANVASPAGTYDISASSGNLTSSNYDFVYSKGTLTVGKATVTVTADNKSKVYGADNPAFTASFNGFVNGETYANSGITGAPQYTTTANVSSAVGDYDINPIVGTLNAINYDFVYVKGTLTIGKAIVTVTAESKGRLYAEANPQFTVTYKGFVNGETLASSGISGVPSINTAATVQSSAGEYAIVPSKGTLASSNYSFAFENGKLWVGKVTVNISADNKSRPYGWVNPPLTITYTGFVNGETLATSGVTGTPTISTTALSSSPMGVYPIAVTIGSLSAVNYDFNFIIGSLTIGKATLTVTADNKSRTYGAVNPSLTYVINGFVNGETLATSGVTGIPALSTSANTLSSVGTYDITPASGTLVSSKYDFVFVKGTLSVEKALISITADNKSRIYGAVNPEFTASYNGFMNGETLASSGITGLPSMTTSATTTSPAGNYTIATALGTLTSGNYKFSTVNGVLTISKATITVSADDKNRIYGSSNPLLTASYSGYVNGENYASSGISGTPTIQTSAAVLSPVGAYDISISSGSLLAANYDFRFVNGKLNVGKATVVVIPDNKSRIYGDANPVFTPSFRGFVNGEILSTSGITGAPALSTMATPLSPSGEYFIYAAGGTLSSSNYEFTFENGVLTIGKATLTVTADNKSRSYGQQNPALTATYNGFKNGETFASSSITGNVSLTTSAVITSNVGNYPITAAKGTLASGNYDFVYVNGVMTIGKSTITIKADDKSRIYGAINPALTASYTGFVNGESLVSSGITGSPDLTTGATMSSSVGAYDIIIANGTLTSSNYDFNLVKGTLIINKATVTVRADNKSRLYGAANPLFTATYNGFVNGETLAGSGISGAPQYATAAIATSPVGSYDISVSTGSLTSGNYQFTFVKGALTIEKATVLVTADDRNRKYGESNPAFTASYSGFVNGESLASSGITGAPMLTTIATSTSTVGTYEITASVGSLSSSNYVFNFRSGMLTVGKAMITVTAENKSKIYGSANPAFTVTYAGYENGENWATSGILGSPAVTTVATASSAVGTYPIVPAIATLFSPNYDFTFVNGVLTVNKAMITVTADNKSRGYGEANPVLTASYNGFVNGEDLASSDIAGSPLLATVATQTSSLGTYPITNAKGTLVSGNYDFAMVNGVLTIGGPVCSVSGSLVVADNCYGSKISLTYINSSFAGPYTLTINDSIYSNVYSGVPFVTGAVAKSAPESIWSTSVIGEDPVNAVTSAIEAGVKFRPNVDGQITGIRFYKRMANTGTHVGSLWTVDGVLLARAIFTNETSSGWQQVTFNTPVTVTPGQVYIASYYSPKGNVAYKSNAFTSNRITNATGSLTALKASDGGNGIYRMGAGFPNQVSADNGNYYVDVVFSNAQSISRFNMTSIISASGCATLSESVQAIDVKMQPLTGVSIVKQDPVCLDGVDGSITLTAIGCNTPYTFSIDNGSTYSSSASFANLRVGTYQIKVKDASNFIKDTSVVLGVEKAIWTGDLSTDWHNAGNWSTGKVPSATTHVIIPFTARECFISAQDVTVSSIQVRQGAIFRALDNRRVIIAGTCAVLPSE